MPERPKNGVSPSPITGVSPCTKVSPITGANPSLFVDESPVAATNQIHAIIERLSIFYRIPVRNGSTEGSPEAR